MSPCDAAEGANTSVTCRELTDGLSDYLAGEMSSERSAALDQHVATCADCANYLAAYRQTLTLTKDAFDGSDAPATDLPEALVKAILAARRPH